ncbi:TROVE domain protein [Chthoniobacter flavus Ellin428]|uniref:TROVE domain protein n=1 Tax=Chthoniobacter flavus Ellin428 TaxID=497964 RepID=B4D8H4_9BACT|nr:TROVE domain-containing protein [Chthoniobacter flavus]EDY17196.1 TROVE domain protein [Chthoniobacter flavus Ellin428]TCO86979.1 60 kDa SS-A/Ro ribonucleoprotein [Chthoniobacter flavus]
MANKSLFSSFVGRQQPQADTRNEAGGPAYRFSTKHALAQYAVTGCLNSTFYASATAQLAQVLKLAAAADAEFVAKTALYCRTRGYMKDMPALLCATLAARDGALLARVFDRVIDDGKMLRNFVQIVRSGVLGRKSLGSAPKRLVQRWFEQRDDTQVFRAAVGQSPSLADVIKMVHPRPADAAREALYGWLIDRPHNADALPPLVRQFEAFKRGHSKVAPDVPFQMLTALPLGRAAWQSIAGQAPWQMTRMNLNTFARHGVFDDQVLTRQITNRLRDPHKVRRARCFPYQLLTAYHSADKAVPAAVRDALQDAMEVATENVPAIQGRVFVCPDVSGSMQSAVTGNRPGATTQTRCIDVAALVAAAVLRTNRDAEVLAFSDHVVPCELNARDSVMTNARKLASLPSGGTNCSAPLRHLNAQRTEGDLVLFVSDNMSWVDRQGGGRSTATMQEWEKFRSRNPRARLVCLDVQPYVSTQAAEREDIMNIGGFSDVVFEIIAAFAAGELSPEHWVGLIEKIEL